MLCMLQMNYQYIKINNSKFKFGDLRNQKELLEAEILKKI